MTAWLAALKEGDEVAVFEGYGRQTARIAKVTRTTANYVFVGASKFHRKNGYTPGDTWCRGRIDAPTQAHRDAWDNTRLREKIRRAVNDSATTLETLRRISAVMEQTK